MFVLNKVYNHIQDCFRNPHYVKNIFEGIDRIAQQRFVNDEMHVMMNENACFFLCELDRFHGFLCNQIKFERIGERSSSHLLATGAKGGKLQKNNFNSYGNRVNPQFIQCLKASTIAYCTLLACGWQETNDPWPKEFGERPDNSITMKSTLEGVGPSHCILNMMAAEHGLQDKIYVQGFVSQNFICGEKNEVTRFMLILKNESFQDTTYKLLKMAKIDKACTFSFLPSEIINMLIKTYFSCTYTKAAYQTEKSVKIKAPTAYALTLTRSYRPPIDPD